MKEGKGVDKKQIIKYS